MKSGLIGYTGFVGQSVDDGSYKYRYNSANITDICGQDFEVLICAGVPGHKTLANRYPERDRESISSLQECLKQVKCQRFILISTVDVYENGQKADEDVPIDGSRLNAYGRHRFQMEEFVREQFKTPYIVRLPGIFGKGLKKNFIFDLIFKIPKMLARVELNSFFDWVTSEEFEFIKDCYPADGQEMRILKKSMSLDNLEKLRTLLERLGCSSLRFTDYRSSYSYYNLMRLRGDITKIINFDIHLINLITEPMTAQELAGAAFDYNFENRIEHIPPATFTLKSKYDTLFGGAGGYLYSKEQVISDLKNFDRNSISI